MIFKLPRLSIHHQAWLFGGFVAVVLGILITSLLLNRDHRPKEEFVLNTMVKVYGDIYQLGGISALQQQVSDNALDTHYLILDADGGKLAGDLAYWTVPNIIESGLNYQHLPSDVALMFVAGKLSDGRQLLVAQDITAQSKRHPDGLIPVLIVLGAIALGGVGSIFAGLFIFRRLEAINQTCKQIIDTGDLSQRIALDGSGKDFDALAANLNTMLAQIEQLMHDVRQVSDNIAHDLRTPLTRLRNKLDSLDIGDKTDLNAVDLKVSALKDEADHLLNLFSALLRITNIESGQRHSQFKALDISQLLQDLVELYEPLATDKGQQLLLSTTPYTLNADGDLLFQALANIVDNAVKYTDAGGCIEITQQCIDNRLEIHIVDNGIGVEAAQMPKLFRRFYRVEQSRHQPGNGLGLSMVAAVVVLHKGTIELEDNAPGLRVKVGLNLTPSITSSITKM